jgi:hypothetical protein
MAAMALPMPDAVLAPINAPVGCRRPTGDQGAPLTRVPPSMTEARKILSPC